MKLDPEWFNTVFPIAEVEVYSSGWKIIRKSLLTPKQIPRGLRGEIRMLTQNSLSRLAFTVLNTPVEFTSIITLTYSKEFPTDGKKVKADLNHFLTLARREFAEFSYVWFIEFQKRGAPHFHILARGIEPNLLNRVKLAQNWVRCVKPATLEEREKMFLVHSHRSACDRIREKNGAKRYALKYCLKANQKVVPKEYRNIGRFWGTSRDIKPELIKRVTITEDDFRGALEYIDNPLAGWGILPKYIFDRSQ